MGEYGQRSKAMRSQLLLSITMIASTYNLCQDEAKSMQQSQHEDVVMEPRVRARHGSVLAIHTQDVLFPGQKESTSMHFHGTPHVFKIFCGAGGTFIRSHIGGGTVDGGSPQETKFTAWMEA